MTHSSLSRFHSVSAAARSQAAIRTLRRMRLDRLPTSPTIVRSATTVSIVACVILFSLPAVLNNTFPTGKMHLETMSATSLKPQGQTSQTI